MSLIDEADNDYVVTQVAPRSTAEIEQIALAQLDALVPGFVGQPQELNLSDLVDHVLPRQGVHFLPVKDHELPEMYAFAQPQGEPGDDIEVLIQETEWDALHAGGRRAHHARGTVAHEYGHCVLHIPHIRTRHALGHGFPRQVPVREIKPFQNAEWQAWAFASSLLAPRASILAMGKPRSVAALAAMFGTSETMMTMHLKRLKLAA